MATQLVLQAAWMKVSETFPDNFKEATRKDAGAEGLRRYTRVKAFLRIPLKIRSAQKR
ncbi:hypothetical protein J5X98_18095 [Leptothermofonsia sichuanensis E412]|uniref:hypothetical protein n=1 Tax=Leptothermofonsia sichuanensis TaxID=2917832 RepID=UPI001CA6463E|nr:hypothetical protein [Leptothermofonsia sichuanensis]QZZ19294.1 hypothetical protein J5X98_18095 [Leptothermofonsia sichuanensis E412]